MIDASISDICSTCRLERTSWRSAYTEIGKPRCADDVRFGSCIDRFLPYLGLRLALYGGIGFVIVSSVLLTRQSHRLRVAFGVPLLPGDITWTGDACITGSECVASDADDGFGDSGGASSNVCYVCALQSATRAQCAWMSAFELA
jgi:hypothetical protein